MREMEDGRTVQWDWVGGAPYADALWTRDLTEEGEADWQFPGEMLKVTIRQDDDVVAGGWFSYLCQGHGGHLACFNVFVDERHRRSGLATALYDAASEQFGDAVLPYPGNEGGAISYFWLERLKDCPDLIERFSKDIGGPALTRSPRPI